MSRTAADGSAYRGSQKWLQRFVAEAPDALQPDGLRIGEWLSPIREERFHEYQDAAFLERLGLGHLRDDLAEFWPAGGPVWDGLARGDDAVVLVEAKAHVAESLTTPCAASSSSSRARIEAAFHLVQADMGARPKAAWTEAFYQYANRLAHLWFLRKRGVDAHLLFVHFLSDRDLGGPDHQETWEAADLAARYVLGLPKRSRLLAAVHHVFPDTRALA